MSSLPDHELSLEMINVVIQQLFSFWRDSVILFGDMLLEKIKKLIEKQKSSSKIQNIIIAFRPDKMLKTILDL